MPYRTKWEARGIIWDFFGYVTAFEIEEANESFYKDERSDLSRFQIINALHVTGVEWNQQKIMETAAQDIGAGAVISEMRVAYVADQEAIIRKLEKYIAISKKLNSSWEFLGFENLDEAMRWATSSTNGK